MAETFVLLKRVELTSSASSILIDSLPSSGYTDLRVDGSFRSNSGSNVGSTTVGVSINGLTTNRNNRRLYGAITPGHDQGTGTGGAQMQTSTGLANTFSNTSWYFPNYTSSNYKSYRIDSATPNSSGTYWEHDAIAGLWSDTSAITSLTFTADGSTFTAGTTVSVYGLSKQDQTPSAAPKADGGSIITNDGTYWYHTFLSSGVFTPQTTLTCDYLVVAGGGSAGYRTANDYYYCGGGGGGGLLTSVGSSGGGGSAGSPLSLTAQSYPVTVGAGGATPASNGVGYNGSNSNISTITAIGGGAGAIYAANGFSGGSGGGAASDSYTQFYGGAGTSGQGYAGGNMETGNALAAGAGGGAGGVGGNGGAVSSGKGGTGGAALANSITGTSVYYAGGGAGGRGYYGSAALGNDGTGYAVATPNRGMGGRPDSAANASGGSGIVIIRYAMA